MNFNKFLLASSFMALMILPACNWFGTTNEPEVVLVEEVVVMEPEEVVIEEIEPLQDQQSEDLELDLLNEK